MKELHQQISIMNERKTEMKGHVINSEQERNKHVPQAATLADVWGCQIQLQTFRKFPRYLNAKKN